MCGIIGKIARTLDSNDFCRVRDALDMMKDRGPDNQSMLRVSDSIIFGHSRLAIIEVSEKSDQPFVIGNFTICFNGEIYNFLRLKSVLLESGVTCQTYSDTEILLRYFIHFGYEKTLNDIDGMFAFAIVDLDNQLCYLARDRFGQKPLYLNLSDGVSFSSTIESLKRISNSGGVSLEFIAEYLLCRHVTTTDSVYNNIEVLAPAECMIVDLTSCKVSNRFTYWQPEYSLSKSPYDIDKIESLIESSVVDHMYSDVPMGLFLSGGIDSSLISYFASKSKDNLEAINVQFTGQSNNEYQYAKYVADKLGIFLHKVELNKFSDTTFDDIQLLLSKIGQPFSDPALLPQYLVAKKAHEIGFKAVLTGDGGDEVFGGYSIYRKARLFEFKKILPYFIYKDLGLLKKGLEQLVYYNMSEKDVFYIKSTIGSRFNFDLFSHADFDTFDSDYMKGFSLCDIRGKLVNEFLPKVDTATMAASIESRSPFLNHKLFEYIWSKDYRKLANLKEGKIPLKTISNKIFGSKFTYRKKMGFEAPVEEWLRQQSTIYEYVFSPERKIFSDGILMFDKTIDVIESSNKFIWRYFNLIIWYENET